MLEWLLSFNTGCKVVFGSLRAGISSCFLVSSASAAGFVPFCMDAAEGDSGLLGAGTGVAPDFRNWGCLVLSLRRCVSFDLGKLYV